MYSFEITVRYQIVLYCSTVHYVSVFQSHRAVPPSSPAVSHSALDHIRDKSAVKKMKLGGRRGS